MDADQVSVAGGLLGVSIAALGLLLTWYRREGQPTGNRRRRQATERTRMRILRGSVAGIVAVTGVGIVLTVLSGGTEADTPPTPTPSASRPTTLSATEYRGRLGQVCSDVMEQYRRIDEVKAKDGDLGLTANVEAQALQSARSLDPPDGLRKAHDDMVAVWGRLITAQEAMYRDRKAGLDRTEIDRRAAQISQLTDDLDTLYARLGVPECEF